MARHLKSNYSPNSESLSRNAKKKKKLKLWHVDKNREIFKRKVNYGDWAISICYFSHTKTGTRGYFSMVIIKHQKHLMHRMALFIFLSSSSLDSYVWYLHLSAALMVHVTRKRAMMSNMYFGRKQNHGHDSRLVLCHFNETIKLNKSLILRIRTMEFSGLNF